MTKQGAGARVVTFVRSVLLVVAIAVGVPWLLVTAARARFGGASPLAGVPSPSEWDAGRIRSALTDRLSDQTVADIVIRLCLLVAWAAVIVLVATIVAELVHMLRHDGLPLPDVRGLGLSQQAARVIASGLLVIVPMFASPSRAVAREGALLVPEQRAVTAATVDGSGEQPPAGQDRSFITGIDAEVDDAGPVAVAPGGAYTVRAGDSIYAIAERLAGPDPGNVTDYAERLLEINLGTEMPDGQLFTNAAFIDVGWVLQLPDTSPSAGGALAASAADGVHVVERGESLWSIAADELGDAERWPEVFEANEGRTFDDGRVLTDPDLIQPGWDLDVPVDASITPVATPVGEPEAPPEPARPDNVWIPKASVVDADQVDEAGVADGPGSVTEHPSTDLDPAGADLVEGATGQATDAAMTTAASVAATGDDGDVDADGQDVGDAAPHLLTYGRAAMLSAGVLTLLAVRRRNQLRRTRPRARLPEPRAGVAATERTLRSIDPGERFDRAEMAIRAAATSLVEHDQRVLAVLVGPDGEIELRSTGPVVLAPPWTGHDDAWQLAASTPVELLSAHARRTASPCPTLVQLGRAADDRDVYVDLEALGAMEIGGPGDQADAIVAAIAATLAGSVLAEVTTLIGLGVADEAFLGHRLHRPVRDSQQAFEAAADAVGSTASMPSSTFELRSSVVSGETWEPAVVLAGSAAGTISPPRSSSGIVVVSAAPIHGPSSRLAPDGDAWVLQPAGLRFVPVGLTPGDLEAIADLVAVPEPPDVSAPVIEVVEPVPDGDDDLTLVPHAEAELHPEAAPSGVAQVSGASAEHSIAPEPEGPDWALLVRLLGPVDVVSPEGASVTFERSKTRELVAWLATHRRRSTRGAARTALWELDVRDATFANVVSEARRALARLVEPPDGEEWVGRTMTDALPLHDLVVTDADLLERALDAAMLQPPAQAMATLAPAVERIAGMPFEGTSYLWPDAEGLTSNLVLLATSAATELAAHCLSVGDIDGVFAATGRGLQVLPGHEELIGLRMQAYARAGDHAGVRQEWESYERVVTADPWSDGEPSPKLVELRRELLNPPR